MQIFFDLASQFIRQDVNKYLSLSLLFKILKTNKFPSFVCINFQKKKKKRKRRKISTIISPLQILIPKFLHPANSKHRNLPCNLHLSLCSVLSDSRRNRFREILCREHSPLTAFPPLHFHIVTNPRRDDLTDRNSVPCPRTVIS